MTQRFGIGEWKTRGGAKAEITEIKAEGFLRGKIGLTGITWWPDGSLRKGFSDNYDLIEPWPKDPLDGFISKEAYIERPKDLRDEFAMAALNGIALMAVYLKKDMPEEEMVTKCMAEMSYEIATAMMEARK